MQEEENKQEEKVSVGPEGLVGNSELTGAAKVFKDYDEAVKEKAEKEKAEAERIYQEMIEGIKGLTLLEPNFIIQVEQPKEESKIELSKEVKQKMARELAQQERDKSAMLRIIKIPSVTGDSSGVKKHDMPQEGTHASVNQLEVGDYVMPDVNASIARFKYGNYWYGIMQSFAILFFSKTDGTVDGSK